MTSFQGKQQALVAAALRNAFFPWCPNLSRFQEEFQSVPDYILQSTYQNSSLVEFIVLLMMKTSYSKKDKKSSIQKHVQFTKLSF